MTDQKYLQYCLYQIEQKLNWVESQSWKETDFLRLSEIISEQTEISISPHTLKRLYGKIKYKKQYNPQRATKDALVKFLGFKDWTEFTSLHEAEISHEAPQNKRQLWERKNIKVGVLVLIILVLFIFLIQRFDKQVNNFEQQNPELVWFKIKDSIGYVPNTVSVRYDIQKLVSDSLYIDFDFTHPINGPEIVKLKKQRSFYNYTFQIPGYYHISLNNNDRELATKNVLVMSQNWDSYFFPEIKPGRWLDNKIQSPKSTGYLYYSPEDLAEKGFNIKSVFYIDHQLFREFGISGDNFEMEVRFKNSEETGGITCYDFLTNLYCEKNLIYFTLMEIGCSGYSGIKVGNTEMTGGEENLSSFTFNYRRWNIFHVVVKEKKVRAYINNKLIYSGSYQSPNGDIVGLEHKFKGTGMLDYIRLKDLGTQKEFFDDFE
ncbi:hypothetical protein [Zunongwangia sp. H14]|uniref:hypothetical protein n=1 Tax=Zunongwangia sp. H14 TaxID=3240792 RepID=UPI003568F574